MTKTRNVVLSVLLLAAGGLAGWVVRTHLPPKESESGEDEDASPHVEPGDMDVEIASASVTSGDLPLVLPVVGVVRADEGALVTLSTRAGGRIVEVTARAGDDVAAGSPVLRLDDAPLRLAAEQAKAALAAAGNQLDEFERIGRDRQLRDLELALQQSEADVTTAGKALDRVTALRRDGLAAERTETEAAQALDRARRERDAAVRSRDAFRDGGEGLQRATLTAARDAAAAALRDAEIVAATAAVVAPSAGRLVALNVHVGDAVDAGAPLGTLLAGDARILAFGVTPAQCPGVRPGSLVTWFDATGAARGATVRSVAGQVTGAAGLVEILASPSPEDAHASAVPPPGLYVRGEIETQRLTGALLVPAAAVVRSDDRTIVVRIGEGGLAKHVVVTVLGRHGDLAAVRGELKAGDRVIVEGGYNLPDGAKVREAAAPAVKKDETEPPESGK